LADHLHHWRALSPFAAPTIWHQSYSPAALTLHARRVNLPIVLTLCQSPLSPLFQVVDRSSAGFILTAPLHPCTLILSVCSVPHRENLHATQFCPSMLATTPRRWLAQGQHRGTPPRQSQLAEAPAAVHGAAPAIAAAGANMTPLPGGNDGRGSVEVFFASMRSYLAEHGTT